MKKKVIIRCACKRKATRADVMRITYGPTEENGWKGNPFQWVRCVLCGTEQVEQPPVTKKFIEEESR